MEAVATDTVPAGLTNIKATDAAPAISDADHRGILRQPQSIWLIGELAVDVLPQVANDLWNFWSHERDEREQQADLTSVLRATPEDIRQYVSELMAELAGDKPPEFRRAVESYLNSIPASVRRSVRRPSDLEGATIPPYFVVQKPEDVLRLLPVRVVRSKPGDHPLRGVDWELDELLGIGGFGEFWSARNWQVPNFEPVALKFCLDRTTSKMLRNEATLLSRVMRQGKHPGIVQLLRTYLSAEIPCLEYELVQGGNLTGLIEEWHRSKGAPSPLEAAKLVFRLAEIVGFAHRLDPPIVHRDLKPGNVLLHRSDDGRLRLKVADFGIGGVASDQAIRETTYAPKTQRSLINALHGSYTPLYAAPQQIRGDPPDPRDDVFSLGVIWYQLLTGKLDRGCPSGTRWQERLVARGMPSRLVRLLSRCIDEELEDRLPDARSLANELAPMFGKSRAPRSSRAPPPAVGRRSCFFDLSWPMASPLARCCKTRSMLSALPT